MNLLARRENPVRSNERVIYDKGTPRCNRQLVTVNRPENPRKVLPMPPYASEGPQLHRNRLGTRLRAARAARGRSPHSRLIRFPESFVRLSPPDWTPPRMAGFFRLGLGEATETTRRDD